MAKTTFCCILVALACGCVQAADSSITDLKSANFQQLKLGKLCKMLDSSQWPLET